MVSANACTCICMLGKGCSFSICVHMAGGWLKIVTWVFAFMTKSVAAMGWRQLAHFTPNNLWPGREEEGKEERKGGKGGKGRERERERERERA